MPTPSVTFPASLDTKFKNIGFSIDTEPNHVVFIPDSGPVNVRRRGTKRRIIYRAPVQLNGTDLATYKTFLDNIKDGSDPFYFTDPQTGVQGVWALRNGSIPVEKNETAGATTNKTYTFSIVFEKLS